MDTPLATSLICQGPLLWQRPEQVLWLVLLAPLLEEWVIRAGLQECWLQRASRPHVPLASRARLGSVLIASLAFCALHASRGSSTVLMVAPVSLLIGTVYARTRSWLACACLHAAGNLAVWASCRPDFI